MIVQSLPTKADPCNPTNYLGCVIKNFNSNLKKMHDCFLPFLAPNGAKNHCSNNVSLIAINLLKHFTTSDEYGTCKNIRPCDSVVYSIVNPSTAPSPPGTVGRVSAIFSILSKILALLV